MVYKTLKKVSNVCQLLDKRTYPATGTENGITFTNNGDGSYTANGTITTDWVLFYVCSGYQLNNPVKLFANHKYLVLNGTNYSKNIYKVWLIVNNALKADSNGPDYRSKTYTPTENVEAEIAIYVRTNIGETVNFTVKPQLFDLTEMYGAGHEPTSVEQFRQDFPEEMYDYSPNCWLTSYKRVFMTGGGNYLTTYKTSLVCKTKNLFDINKVTETGTLKVIGNSIYSYGYPVVSYDTSTLSIFKSLKPNTNYTMSAITNYLGDSSTHITLIFNNGIIDVLENYKSGFVHTTFSLTQGQIDNIIAVYFYGKPESQGGPVIWNNIQIELGDTATDYVPYGHL